MSGRLLSPQPVHRYGALFRRVGALILAAAMVSALVVAVAPRPAGATTTTRTLNLQCVNMQDYENKAVFSDQLDVTVTAPDHVDVNASFDVEISVAPHDEFTHFYGHAISNYVYMLLLGPPTYATDNGASFSDQGGVPPSRTWEYRAPPELGQPAAAGPEYVDTPPGSGTVHFPKITWNLTATGNEGDVISFTPPGLIPGGTEGQAAAWFTVFGFTASGTPPTAGATCYVTDNPVDAPVAPDPLPPASTEPLFTTTIGEASGVAPTFTAASPPDGTVGSAYSYTFAASGYPAPTYAVGSGTLPDGLSLNATTGELSGTPTTAGEYTFGVTATNASGTDHAAATVKVRQIPTITPANPPAATAGEEYSYNFAASGSPAPVFSLGPGSTLPPGLSLSSTGVLSGAPTTSGHYSFTVTATNVAGADSRPVSLTVKKSSKAPSYWHGWTIARDVVANPNGDGGWTLDAWGGLHTWGGAPRAVGSAYWRGWGIARDLALNSSGSGYVLDGWGGLHPVNGAPRVSGPYWRGWDIARKVVLNPAGPGGWVLDGWGGVHPFGGAMPLHGTPYWRGWDIARDLVVNPDGTSGYVLDGWGGVHPFGGAPPVGSPSYTRGVDIAKGLAVTGSGSGYVLDGWGGLHSFGGAPDLTGVPHWGDPNTHGGWDIARAVSFGSGGRGYVLDGWGGIHTVS